MWTSQRIYLWVQGGHAVTPKLRLGFQFYFQAKNIFCTIWTTNTGPAIIDKEKRHRTPLRVSVYNDNVGKENVFLPKWHGKANYFDLLISLEETHQNHWELDWVHNCERWLLFLIQRFLYNNNSERLQCFNLHFPKSFINISYLIHKTTIQRKWLLGKCLQNTTQRYFL